MIGITGFRTRAAKKDAASTLNASRVTHLDANALERVTAKIIEMSLRFDSMTEEEFNQWLDALPREEFYEWIALGAEGIGAIIRESRRRAA
jgi:hypothetical protein